MARVLVIDDDRGMRDLIGAWLSLDGHECHVVENGHEGVSLLRHRPIDLVVTDLVMKYDGITTIRVIRWEFPKIGIIAMTGYAKERLEQARLVGADRGLQKPFEAAALRAEIAALLATGRSAP